MTHYLQLDAEGRHQALWKLTGSDLELIYGPYRGPLPVAPGFSVEDTLRQLPGCSNHVILLAELGLGEYFPRMARPQFKMDADLYFCADCKKNEVANFTGQLAVLAQQLEDICRVVQPTPTTLSSCFGHEIRNLLILACTEVETHWRGVLEANGATHARPTTNDYVQLSSAMKLQEYAVAYPNYPWLSPFRPFERWGSSGKPTQELDWYDAYNNVKHDRERQFEQATLGSAFEAVTACAIMHFAEFGQNGLPPRLRRVFALRNTPNWLPSELYLVPTGAVWKPKNYRFP